jgi:DNA-binding response OmpR family regulator
MKVRILVVEDDSSFGRWMCDIMRRNDFEVLQAVNGKDALNIMGKQHVDMVITDILMPEMCGYELTEDIRAWPDEKYQNIPILMVSALQEQSDVNRGLRKGANDYMKKEPDIQELLLRINNLLRQAKIKADRKIVIGDVTLNHDSFTVSRGQEEVTLRRKEFKLLYTLFSEEGRIFTKTELKDEVWGIDSETDEHTVNVHIGRLRDRFRDWPELEIMTVRGVGYKAVKKA